MASVRLPSVLVPVFPGLPRVVDLDAPTVGGLILALDERWPGLGDRLCDRPPTHARAALRPHINVYVDRERAQLSSPVGPASRVDVIAAISGG